MSVSVVSVVASPRAADATVPTGDAVMSLLSLGSLSPTTMVSPSTSSYVASPSPRHVASLESTSRSTSNARFEFARLAAKENETSNSLPPRESSYKTNTNAHKRASSVRVPAGPQPLPPSLALALQSAQAASAQQRASSLAPVAHTSPPNTPRTLPLHPLSDLFVSAPHQVALPVRLCDGSTPAAARIPAPHELDTDPNRTMSPINVADITAGSESQASHATVSASHIESAAASVVAAPATPLHHRSISSPGPLTPLTPTAITANTAAPHATPSPLAAHYAYTTHLLRARSAGSSGMVGPASCAASTLAGHSRATAFASPTSTRTSYRIGTGPSYIKSAGPHSISRVRVCIKPIDQLRLRATALIDEARNNGMRIHTYEFP